MLSETLFRWLSVTEVGKENADAPRKYHHHILMHGIPRESAESLRTYGRANSKALQPDRQGLNALAGYICKSRAFYRQFRHSNNLKQPVETVSDRKISSAKVRRIAADVQTDGREILERAYPEYELADKIDVRYSDYVSGAYIYATMHKKTILAHDTR